MKNRSLIRTLVYFSFRTRPERWKHLPKVRFYINSENTTPLGFILFQIFSKLKWDAVNWSSVESVVWTSFMKRVWESIWRGLPICISLFFMSGQAHAIYRVHEPKEKVQPSRYKCDRCADEFESKVLQLLYALECNGTFLTCSCNFQGCF